MSNPSFDNSCLAFSHERALGIIAAEKSPQGSGPLKLELFGLNLSSKHITD